MFQRNRQIYKFLSCYKGTLTIKKKKKELPVWKASYVHFHMRKRNLQYEKSLRIVHLGRKYLLYEKLLDPQYKRSFKIMQTHSPVVLKKDYF